MKINKMTLIHLMLQDSSSDQSKNIQICLQKIQCRLSTSEVNVSHQDKKNLRNKNG